VRPGKRVLTAVIGLLVIAITVSFYPQWVGVWWLGVGGLIGFVMYDYYRVASLTTPTVQRFVASSLPIGVWSNIRLHIRNTSDQSYSVSVFDHYPVEAEIEGMPRRIDVPAQQALDLHYRIRPTQRGDTCFSRIQLVLHSPLDMCRHTRWIESQDDIKVYPNFSAVVKYALLATDNKLSELGIRKRQQRGEGLEFHQLREYRQGDSLRQIDWKATSRIKKLISKEYQQERDQQIVFLLDCGRRMRTQDAAVSHFDHALNAMLLLSYVALRQNDAAGFMTFSTEQARWLKPKKGAAMLNTILNSAYALQPSLQSADYMAAAEQLLLHQQKRALILILSNVRDEDNDNLQRAVKLLQKRHLVLIANLREKKLDEVLAQPIQHFSDAIRYAATCGYLETRQYTQQNLRHNGVSLLDVNPEALATALVNRYLEIKQSGLL